MDESEMRRLVDETVRLLKEADMPDHAAAIERLMWINDIQLEGISDMLKRLGRMALVYRRNMRKR
jgi:hypothetical protein